MPTNNRVDAESSGVSARCALVTPTGIVSLPFVGEVLGQFSSENRSGQKSKPNVDNSTGHSLAWTFLRERSLHPNGR